MRIAEARWRARQPALVGLSAQRQAFVLAYIENGGRGELAALRAGYSSASAGRGGRAAAVRACKLLKDTEIRRAIDEIRAERAAALSALAAERGRQKLRAKLSAIAVADGPQSAAARILRRLDRQPAVRVPDHCRCGGPVTPGCASCESCRFRRREYRRRWRADPWHRERERLLRREREWAVHAAKAAAIV